MRGTRGAGPGRLLRLRISLAALAVALVAAGCGDPGGTDATKGGDPSTEGRLPVVATTTVLADMVAQVGGENVSVSSLVPPGGEVHTFDPTPSDLARVADARLIVMNGLGLDDWLGGLAEDSGTEAAIVVLGGVEGVEYVRGGEHDHEHEGAEAPDEIEPANPHLWLDVANGIRYAERIGEALAEADPANATAYEASTRAYVERLTELDRWAREQLAAIPAENRRIVSFHEAFPYFARAYGLEIVGTVISAPGQDPSAGEIAELVSEIRATGARAVFSEAQFSPDLAEAIAEEAGVTVEANLYNDSLGGDVDSYEALIRWNVERVVAALQ